MPTPRRSRRFGSSAAHQRLMMANLAASLFAAEAIHTTEAKAKAEEGEEAKKPKKAPRKAAKKKSPTKKAQAAAETEDTQDGEIALTSNPDEPIEA